MDKNSSNNIDKAQEDLIPTTEKEPHISEVDNELITTICSQRWILAYIGLLFGIIICMYRADMSIAIVCMVRAGSHNNTAFLVTDNNTFNNVSSAEEVDDDPGVCREDLTAKSAILNQGEFDWDKETQSYILSAYFYGYIVSQIPGGWLSARYGGKHVISISMTLSALFTLLIPVLARTNPYTVVMARALIGFLAGFTTPAYFALVSVWALPNERSRFLALVWFGQNIGMMIGYMSSGELCANGFDHGWGSIFYVHGIIGALFMVVWLYFIASTPQSHPRITDAEKKKLEILNNNRHKVKKKTPQVPWLKVATTASSWAVLITHTFDNFMYYLIVTCLPLFLKDVLKFDIQSNGLYSSLPFLSILVGLATSGTLADCLISRRIFTRTRTRKVLQITGLLGECIFIITASYTTCDKKEIVIVCLCLCTFFESMGMAAGYPCNLVDMAPSYAPLLFGVSNCIATLPGLAAPLVVAKLTPNGTTEEWRMVFFIAAGLVLGAALVYGLFSTSDVVSWAEERNGPNQEIVINEIDKQVETEMLSDGCRS